MKCFAAFTILSALGALIGYLLWLVPGPVWLALLVGFGCIVVSSGFGVAVGWAFKTAVECIDRWSK